MPTNSLSALVEGLRAREPTRRTEELSGILFPLVRLAVVEGKGVPKLLRWVERTKSRLASEGSSSPPNQEFASTLSKHLAESLLRQADSNPTETRALEETTRF